jgi:hypothetical protein
MHGGHHTLSEQDLLNLHNAGALPSLDDGQVCIFFSYQFLFFSVNCNIIFVLNYSRYFYFFADLQLQ